MDLTLSMTGYDQLQYSNKEEEEERFVEELSQFYILCNTLFHIQLPSLDLTLCDYFHLHVTLKTALTPLCVLEVAKTAMLQQHSGVSMQVSEKNHIQDPKV